MSEHSTAEKFRAWVAIARLQFHPMAFLAYAMGAAAAPHQAGAFHWSSFWLGYAVIFALELATIFTNELFDYPSDLQNRNFGPFTGGSRVLVQERLGFGEVKAAVALLVGAAVLLAFLLVRVGASSAGAVAGFVAVALFLGLGYTAPPLKFSHRSLGELVVGVTHSFLPMVDGHLF